MISSLGFVGGRSTRYSVFLSVSPGREGKERKRNKYGNPKLVQILTKINSVWTLVIMRARFRRSCCLWVHKTLLEIKQSKQRSRFDERKRKLFGKSQPQSLNPSLRA